MHTTSASLLCQLKQTNAAVAWTRFVELYTPLLHYWARRAGLQDQDADDLVQDIFVTLLAKLPEFSYDPGKSFRSWLRTVVHNRWRNRLRDQQKLPKSDQAELLAEQAVPDPLEEFWETEYRQQLIALAMQRLRDEFQPSTWQACWALVVEGKDPPDVARQLGISLGAVYIAKSRVLARLREHLAGMLE